MIVSLICMVLFSFVWVPLGARLSNHLYPAYGIMRRFEPSLFFMGWWILVGIGISVLIVHRYEVWID